MMMARGVTSTNLARLDRRCRAINALWREQAARHECARGADREEQAERAGSSYAYAQGIGALRIYAQGSGGVLNDDLARGMRCVCVWWLRRRSCPTRPGA